MKERLENSRTKSTLENLIRVSLHPKGAKEFFEDMNKELELGPKQSSFNKGIGVGYDVFKYLAYSTMVGLIAYEIFK